MSDPRQIILNLNPMPGGFSAGGWRTGERPPEYYASIEHFAEVAEIAERGKFDGFFLADFTSWSTEGVHRPPRFLDPIVVLSYLSARTSHIGLIATASTSYNTPYNLARRLMSLDHVSDGRFGWNVVVTAGDDAARNFSLDAAPPKEARYARAKEFVDVVQALWASWDEDAVIADVDSGVYVDAAKVHAVDFAGEHFRIPGPLVTGRSPQGAPILVQAGGSPMGTTLAARYAHAVFTVQNDIDISRAYRRELRERVAEQGRDPDIVKLLPGVVTVVGRTEEEAHERAAYLTNLVPLDVRLGSLAHQLQLPLDALSGDIDGQLPWDLVPAEAMAGHDHRATLLKGARDRAQTIRQLIDQPSSTHLNVTGSPEQIADTLQHWFETGAADGFNIMPAELPKGVSDFVDLVVPILQRRGLFKREYRNVTLRDRYAGRTEHA
jgi:FMN-dependent oxidoreductase (nitrilotriacetate monooxygenase family)